MRSTCGHSKATSSIGSCYTENAGREIEKNRDEIISLIDKVIREKGDEREKTYNTLINKVKTSSRDTFGKFGDKDSILIYAIINECSEKLIEKIIVKTKFIDCKDKNGQTALMHAAIKDYFYIIEIFRSLDVNVSLEDKNGQTALMLAAKHGHKNFLESMLKFWPTITEKEKQQAILLSYKNNHEDVVLYLIGKLNQDNITNGISFELFEIAVYYILNNYNNLTESTEHSILNIIVNNSNKFNYYNLILNVNLLKSIINLSNKYDNRYLLKVLLNENMVLDKENKEKILSGNEEILECIVDYLLIKLQDRVLERNEILKIFDFSVDYGIKVLLKEIVNSNGDLITHEQKLKTILSEGNFINKNAVHYFLTLIEINRLDDEQIKQVYNVVKKYIEIESNTLPKIFNVTEKYAKINKLNKLKDNIVHVIFKMAFNYRNLDILEGIYDIGTIKNNEIWEALLFSDNNNDQELVDCLVEKIDANTTVSGDYTPLMLAAKTGCVKLVCKLWPKTKNPLQTDGEGYTALMLALVNGHHEVIKAVFDLDPAKKLCPGFSRKSIVATLLERGAKALGINYAKIDLMDSVGRNILAVLLDNENVTNDNKISIINLIEQRPTFIEGSEWGLFKEIFNTRSLMSENGCSAITPDSIISEIPTEFSNTFDPNQRHFQDNRSLSTGVTSTPTSDGEVDGDSVSVRTSFTEQSSEYQPMNGLASINGLQQTMVEGFDQQEATPCHFNRPTAGLFATATPSRSSQQVGMIP